jgi:hypothetical protein
LYPIKKRQNQFVGQIEYHIKFDFLLGLFVYRSLNLSGETCLFLRKVLGCFYLFAIVLLVLANKAHQKDEDLVKSVDRLR